MLINRLKGFARNFRDGGLPSAFKYLRERRIFQLIRCIPESLPRNSQEIHVLIGHERISMLLWMAASLIVASKTRWCFVVHDDGTLQDSDEAVLSDCMPGCRVIRSMESDVVIREELRIFPLLARYRSQHPFGKRLTDFPFFCKSNCVVSIDSDILFFRNPTLFLPVEASQVGQSVFLRDVENTSLITAEAFAAKFQRELAAPLNAGMFAIPSHFMHLEVMEEMLREFSLLDIPKSTWFIEQTILGALASLKGDVTLLPKSYQQTLDGALQDDAVMRHYVGKVRHLFYSEGLEKVAAFLAEPANSAEACAS